MIKVKDSMTRRTKEQFLEDYQEAFDGDDENGYIAKDQAITDIYTYTNHDIKTLEDLKYLVQEDDDMTELHNSIMSNLFGDGDDYQGSFKSDSHKGKGIDEWYLNFGEIIFKDSLDGFIYRNITLIPNRRTSNINKIPTKLKDPVMSANKIVEEVKNAFPDNIDDIEWILEDLADGNNFAPHASIFADAGELQNIDLANKLIEHAISSIEYSSDARDCVEALANPDGLNDLDRAREVMKIAIDKVDDHYDTQNCANLIANDDIFGDKDWAREVYRIALDTVEDIDATPDIAQDISIFLGDKKWSREILKSVVGSSDDNYSLLECAKVIADDRVLDDKKWAREVYETVLKLSESDIDELKSTIASIKEEFNEEWADELMKKYEITDLYG